MTEATKNEIIKAMAYRYSDADIADNEDMSIEDVAAFRKDHEAEIKAKESASDENN